MNNAAITRSTTCPLDCPDLCALEVTIEGGRIVQIDGRADDPVTDGFICGKVRQFAEHVYGPERLLSPARRVGRKGEGRFVEIGWDEALDRIADEVRRVRERWGGEAILPFCYGGSNGKFTHDAIDSRFFRRLGASQLARTVCAAPTGRVATEMYGKMHGVGYEDYAAAKLIVVWGANPQTSGIHLVPFIKAARQQGARLVVVDPRATPLARQADLHLAVRPGTDVAAALSVIRWFFETGRADQSFLERHATGVAELRQRAAAWTFERAAAVAGIRAEDLATFAHWYADTSPAVIRCGWGIERTRSAGSNVAAVLALPAVAGKFGVRGGGYTLSNSGAWKFNADAAIGQPPTATRTVNMNQLGQALTQFDAPPVQLLFVYNANPVATIPHQGLVQRGLEREDLFTVVFEQVRTDTTRFADVLLPATTFLEHFDFRAGYGYSQFRQLRPVIERVGLARPNYEVFAELCRRCGIERPDDATQPSDWLRRMLGNHPEAEVVWDELQADRAGTLPDGGRPIPFVDLFPGTPDRKIQLCPPALDRESPQGLYQYLPLAADPRFPLQMISPATERLVNSTLGQLWRQYVPLEMNPIDAAARRIDEGQAVRVYNTQGEVLCPVKLTPEVRPGVVVLPKGLWSRHTYNGRTSNTLAPDTLTDVAGGACFNDTWVEVEPSASEAPAFTAGEFHVRSSSD